MLERALKMRRPFCYNFSTLFGKVQQGLCCRGATFSTLYKSTQSTIRLGAKLNNQYVIYGSISTSTLFGKYAFQWTNRYCSDFFFSPMLT